MMRRRCSGMRARFWVLYKKTVFFASVCADKTPKPAELRSFSESISGSCGF
ncbi:hypothetical protein PATSB16_32480 [Pandoraea thiooxydans]|nr:hypothetical protein PATSB16_32480 [Pandoraea thiooxydans]